MDEFFDTSPLFPLTLNCFSRTTLIRLRQLLPLPRAKEFRSRRRGSIETEAGAGGEKSAGQHVGSWVWRLASGTNGNTGVRSSQFGDGRGRTFNVQHPTSNTQHRTLNIEHRTLKAPTSRLSAGEMRDMNVAVTSCGHWRGSASSSLAPAAFGRFAWASAGFFQPAPAWHPLLNQHNSRR